MNPNDLPSEDQPRPTEEERNEMREESLEEARDELDDDENHVLKLVEYGEDSETGETVVETVRYIPDEQIDAENLGSMKTPADSWTWMTYAEANEDAKQYSDDQLLHE